jgi:hypothetical protein
VFLDRHTLVSVSPDLQNHFKPDPVVASFHKSLFLSQNTTDWEQDKTITQVQAGALLKLSDHYYEGKGTAKNVSKAIECAFKVAKLFDQNRYDLAVQEACLTLAIFAEKHVDEMKQFQMAESQWIDLKWMQPLLACGYDLNGSAMTWMVKAIQDAKQTNPTIVRFIYLLRSARCRIANPKEQDSYVFEQ